MNKDKRNNIQLLGTLNNSDESGIIANANQIYDANEDKSTQDVSKEHKERIETLETKENSMQTTLENITKTGEASAASNVTYNHSDSKLDATNVQQAVDEVRKRSNYNDGDNIIDFNTIHIITDNPEYICVAVDADDKIIYGIKTDGQPYFGVGCPKQVKDYIDKQINKILGTNDITTTIDSLKEIEAFLKDFTNSDTLKKLLDLKANVDEVRITTNDIYKKSNPNDSEGNVVDTNTIVSIENNPEYIKVITDNVGKLIEAIGLDGIRKFFAGIEVQGTLQCVTDNPEYIAVWLDNQERIVFGFKINGDPYFGYGIPSQINSVIELLKSNTKTRIDTLQQSIDNKIDTKQDKEEGKVLVDKNIADSKNLIDDVEERVSVNLDNDDRVISYRDKDGALHENKIVVDELIASNIKADGLKDIVSVNNPTDFSNYITNGGDKPLVLPEPRCAYLNFITDDNSVTRLGIKDNEKFTLEFWDGYGNYFSKKVLASTQGDSSKAQWKRNIGIDLFDEDWGGDAFAIKFGDWVAQDSFHLKAYYEDVLRGVNTINYKLCNLVAQTYDHLHDRPYKEYISPTATNAGTEDIANNDARTISDGFPAIVYLNGKFYGVFAMQLKKHRDNFNMHKDTVDNIHLDGYLGSNFWNGTIGWTAFEIRNPKPKKWKLLCQDGSNYDGDHPKEIMGTDSPNYNADDESCTNSAKLKEILTSVSQYLTEIKAYEEAYNADKTDEKLTALKAEIEKRFGVKWLIDYILEICFIQDKDSVDKNWQWVTWGKIDGIYKMFVCPWDMDSAYGINSTTGFSIGDVDSTNIGNNNGPARLIWAYYKDDLKARYKELRDLGVFSERTITNLIYDWVHRIGDCNYKLEFAKWSESPCHRTPTMSADWNNSQFWYNKIFYWEYNTYNNNTTYTKDSYVKQDHILYKSLKDNNIGHTVTDTEWWENVCWKEGTTYTKGQSVYDGYDNFYYMTAQKDTTERPFSKFYEHYPRENGNFDSISRIVAWIEKKITALDKQFEYNK